MSPWCYSRGKWLFQFTWCTNFWFGTIVRNKFELCTIFEWTQRTCFVSEIKRRQLLLFFILLFSLCCFHVSQNTLIFNLRFALKMFSCAITLFSNVYKYETTMTHRGCLLTGGHLALHRLPPNDSLTAHHHPHSNYHIHSPTFVNTVHFP